MQSNDDFSVGGSISVNCHGWQFNHAPIASTVDAFRLMQANGTIVKCSRTENSDLFSLALGGYGLFGVILDVDLRVVPNERYRIERVKSSAADYAKTFQQKAAAASDASDIVMVYGRLNVTRADFLQDGIVNLFHRLAETNRVVTALTKAKDATLKRAIFRGSAGSDYGKELRWTAESYFTSLLEGDVFERNAVLSTSASWFENRSKATTDILV